MALPCASFAEFSASPGHQLLIDAPRLCHRTGRLQPLHTRTERHKSSWLPRAAALWQQLPPDLTRLFPPEDDNILSLVKAAQRLH